MQVEASAKSNIASDKMQKQRFISAPYDFPCVLIFETK
jgi:hypothetical protein